MASNLTRLPEVVEIATANTKFAFDLFRECGQALKDENLFISPFSISTALALTHIGARGQTAAEMKKVLHWSDKSLDKGYGTYLPLLKESADPNAIGYVLIGAQRIYIRNDLQVKPEFTRMAVEQYQSDAKLANFKGNPNGEREAINRWVEEQTRGKIKDLLPDGSINPLTAMVLLQAIYFKGKWREQFDPKRTRPDNFYSPRGNITVDMMSMEEKFPYHKNDELKCSAVELPYLSNKAGDSGYDLSMLILLPDDKDGLPSLEAALTHDMLMKIRSSLHSVKVDLKLPRFSMESTLELKDALSKLGMPAAFSDGADFTGMADELFIDEVFHKAHVGNAVSEAYRYLQESEGDKPVLQAAVEAIVEVNEEGSEAAAATGVVMRKRSIPIIHPFIADHPFLFLIIDQRADFILFMGRLVSPKSSASHPKQEL